MYACLVAGFRVGRLKLSIEEAGVTCQRLVATFCFTTLRIEAARLLIHAPQARLLRRLPSLLRRLPGGSHIVRAPRSNLGLTWRCTRRPIGETLGGRW